MVIVDHVKNIERIINKVKSDKTLYDNGETLGKFRSVTFGNPENNDKLAIKAKPALYVTTKDSMQNTNYNFGQVMQNNQNQITVEYELVIIAASKFQSKDSQKQLYELIKNLRELVTDDPQFFNGDDLDPIFSRSIITNVTWESKTKGQLITSASLSLLATIGTAFTITIPGIGLIPLLSKPNNPEGVIYSEDRTQEIKNRVLTENGDFGSLSVEYESSVVLNNMLREKLGVEEDVILFNGENRTIHVKYIDINSTAQFDQIERSILHMEVI